MAALMETPSMHDIYLWLVTAVTGAVAANTLLRLWTERSRLWQEDLHDEDRLFAWRIVLFLIYPIMTLVDLRATMVTCNWFGGYIKDWTYGLFWYSAVPRGIASHEHLLFVLFAGVIVQLLLAFSLLPSLAFRPHPFFATIIGYAITTVLGLNLVVDPLLSLLGVGGSRWQLLMVTATAGEKLYIGVVYALAAAVFLSIVCSERTRLWFADLSRPLVSEELRDVISQWKLEPANPHLCARLAILFERAGLRRKAAQRLAQLRVTHPRTIYSTFVDGVLSYRSRKYKIARARFLEAADHANTDPQLRGALLAAAGCAAFAEGDLEGALNLSERALEFDDAGLVARMVKVDVFLRTGKNEQAGEEIIAAIRRGLDLDLESKVPLDTERALQRIGRMHAAERRAGLQLASRAGTTHSIR
jgi:hypothetical protein